jgi:hypothetical protein
MKKKEGFPQKDGKYKKEFVPDSSPWNEHFNLLVQF